VGIERRQKLPWDGSGDFFAGRGPSLRSGRHLRNNGKGNYNGKGSGNSNSNSSGSGSGNSRVNYPAQAKEA
jgi:hypothetical protein